MKFLLAIDFRYHKIPENEYESEYKNKIVTIGVFDTFDEASKEGNKVLENIFEKKFELHKFDTGNYAPKQRFSKDGGCFGSKKALVTNLGYLKTPFEFYFKITELKYFDIEETIDDLVEVSKKYKEFKNNNNK